MADDGREFYVGYKPEAPDGLARFLRRKIYLLVGSAIACAVLLAAAQTPLADSFFEFGDVRSFEGRLSTAPHPSLEVESEGGGEPETHLLVSFGKVGADDAVAGLDGRRVRLDGQRIYRQDSKMVELSEGLVDLDAAGAPAAPRSLGEHELVGEIVDSKCHLGVMKPGEGKPHRACATRCISGGVPPLLWVRDHAGEELRLLLVGRDGRQLNGEVLDRVAEPVKVTGEVLRRGDLWLLRTEPDEIRRVESR